MKPSYLTALIMAALLGTSSARAADHGSHVAAMEKQGGTSDHAQNAIPKLILAEPQADILKGGHVYLPFRVENMAILPMYAEINGEEVTQLRPRIGHLHVGVDGNQWVWIHASADPIYFGQLSPGSHRVRVELVDAAHKLIEVQTIEVVVP